MIVIPILQMMKLRHRDVSYLPKVTQLENCRDEDLRPGHLAPELKL